MLSPPQLSKIIKPGSQAAPARRHFFLLLSVFGFGLVLAALPVAHAGQTDILGPVGSSQFGKSVTVLPNGNFVVTDPLYDTPSPGSIANVGAVYLYNGLTLALISTLTGSKANDQIGVDGVTVLSNGNFVVPSRLWDNGALVNAGAVTWGSGTSGVSGAVSATNSLVGGTANDQVGNEGVTALSNGNYVVSSTVWDNGAIVNVGAATWGNGATGTTGVVSAANSLVGSTANDQIGMDGVIALNNGNYVVISTTWDNGAEANAGAVTWGSGTNGVSGVVSAANSLVGGTASDTVGNGGVTALNNGNYVVHSTVWDNGAVFNAGAMTWGNGMTGISGEVSAVNSLVGSTASDTIGNGGVTTLNNGNYVVRSPAWDNGVVANAGAVTWGNGTNGVRGEVSAANSLVGTMPSDSVGNNVVMALNNGNYVVSSSTWDNGLVVNVGAVTWGNGTSGIVGAVSVANSLVGSTAGDSVGNGNVTALSNGNFVVISTVWDNGAVVNVGAVTWGNGTNGLIGAVSPANSLIGSTANDQVGSSGATALNNGNYVVSSIAWDNGGIVNAGALTWGNGTTGVSGEVSPINSLVGSTMNDTVGNGGVTALNNGNYVVSSPNWINGAVVNVGAVTWGSGAAGVSGAVSATNSLIGSTANDTIGNSGVTGLSNGNYVVNSTSWDNGAVVNVGALTWGNGTTGVTGAVSTANSLVGSTANDIVGDGGVTVLNNGNYVVSSLGWDNGAVVNAGAMTWGNGTTGVAGAVSAANSLVGSTANDNVDSTGAGSLVIALNNGNYVVHSVSWDNGAVVDAGAMTLGDGTLGTSGAVSPANSVIGNLDSGGDSINFAYDFPNSRLLVGYPGGNRVSIFSYATPVVPVLLRPIAYTNGIFRFEVSGPTGPNYVILASTNLVNWTALKTNLAPSTPFQFNDTNAVPVGQKFYRARLQP